jgi:hypothetical protein
MSNLLGVEPLIVARLEEKLAAHDPRPHILTAPDLADVAEEKQLTPAVHVVYGGMRIAQDDGHGSYIELEQTWYTVIAVRNLRDMRKGSAARADAGELLDAVFRALTGWKPGLDIRALRPATAPRAAYSGGFGYYPLAWTTRMQMRGEA